MRIGVVPNLDREFGGTYQYATTVLRALASLNLGDEITIFTYPGESLPDDLIDIGFATVEIRTVTGPARRVWEPISRSLSPKWRQRLRRTAGALAKRSEASSATDRKTSDRQVPVDPIWRQWFERHGTELLVFTNENDFAFLTGVPYVVAIHDLQHRLHPEFEEVSVGGEEGREYRIGNCVRNATLILCESEVGKEDMLDFYGPEGVADDAVFVLPHLQAYYMGGAVSSEDRARVRQQYDLPETYLFYPAQFVPSKNHVRIVEALGRLRDEGKPVGLVLAGSHKGELRGRVHAEVFSAVDRLGLQDSVMDLGYAPDDAMPALYAEALALIMPTFFGPSNLPVFEAWSADCPVITSDIRGIREQSGDAALLVDPESVDSIADGIAALLDDPALGEAYRERGRARLATYTPEDFAARLASALTVAKRRLAVSSEGRS